MSASIATQTTTFLPKFPPVLKGSRLSKRFFSRMDRILAKDMAKGKKINKQLNETNRKIRQLMTNMGNIGDENRKYYKLMAKDKQNRRDIYNLRIKAAKAEDKKAARLAKEKAIADKKAARLVKEKAIADKKAARLAKEQAQSDNEMNYFINTMGKLARDNAKDMARIQKTQIKIAKELAQEAKLQANLEKDRKKADNAVAKAAKATARTQKEIEAARKHMQKVSNLVFEDTRITRKAKKIHLGDTTVVY